MHLTSTEREEIYLGINLGLSLRQIGEKINRSHSIISREIKRNKGPNNNYSPGIAGSLALKRRTKANRKNPLKNEKILSYIKEKLILNWSPEQISGRIKIDLSLSISHEAIYQHIYRKENNNLTLWVYLRRSKPKRSKKGSRKTNKIIIPNKILIDKRPEYINNRLNIGHWESDLIIGKQKDKSTISVTVERKTRFIQASLLKNKTSEEKTLSLLADLGKFPPFLRKSITFDNGTENAKHENVAKDLSLKTYFCHPYASYERGTVENTNGLLRQYFPKKTSFDLLSKRDVKMIVNLLNDRPRKCLGYKTPYEVFYKELNGAF